MRRAVVVAVVVLLAAGVLVALTGGRGALIVGWARAHGVGTRTVGEVVAEHAPSVEAKLRPVAERRGLHSTAQRWKPIVSPL